MSATVIESSYSAPAQPGLPPQLTPMEARILGSLVEKAATTPDVYPLTLNNVVLACNQKTAREPTMNLNPGDIGHALRQLEVRCLVKSEYGARSERYLHRIERVFDLTPAQTCLLSLLFLRGPQTLHELLARSERQHRFADIDDVRHTLERLAEREPSMIRRLPRGGGQREDRYAHLFCGEPAMPERSAETPSRTHDGDAMDALLARIEALETRVAVLESGGATLASDRAQG